MKSEKLNIEVYETLNDSLQTKIDSFRKNNPGIKKRTEKEEKEHTDKYSGSSGDIQKWVIAFLNGEIVGTIAVFQRTIKLNGNKICIGGIGRVRVAIKERGKGIASEMMRVAVKGLHEIHSDVAFLCTDLNSFLADWYKKYGFVVLNKAYTYTGVSGKKYKDTDGMVAPIFSQPVFNELLHSQEVLDLGYGCW